VRVRAELALEVQVHNLLVLHRSSSQKQNAQEICPTHEPTAAKTGRSVQAVEYARVPVMCLVSEGAVPLLTRWR
jgi:hypothetical protein